MSTRRYVFLRMITLVSIMILLGSIPSYAEEVRRVSDDKLTTAQRMFGQVYPKIEAKGNALDKEFAVVTVDGIFNKIYARESQLDLKTRELCTISFLTALGRPDELGLHLVVAFNLGWTFEELREAMLLAVVPAGWPASLDALTKLYGWCKEHDIPVTPGRELRDGFAETDWYKAGYDNGVRLFGQERWKAPTWTG